MLLADGVLILRLVSLILMAPIACSASAKPCQVRLKCTDEEDTAWATEGDACYVFLNKCELRNENCLRHNFYFRTLMPVEREKCQSFCSETCTKRTGPICAEYRNQKRAFKDYCAYSYHVCITGERYKSPMLGDCTGQ